MAKQLRLAHILGLSVFLGSVVAFALISALTADASLAELAFARKIITEGIRTLTLPGMWMLALTGVGLALAYHAFSNRMVQIKLLLLAAIVLNSHLVIVPAADAATELVATSLVQGRLLPEYSAAYQKESLFGAINVMLAVTAASLGVLARKKITRHMDRRQN